MYCPSCGTSTSVDQKFCRGCGLDLAPVSQMLAGGAVSQPRVTGPSQVQSSDSDPRRIFRWGFILFWGGIVLSAMLGIVGDAISNLVPRLGNMIESMAGLGGLVLLIGIGTMIYSRLVLKAQQSQAFIPPPANSAHSPRAIGEPPASTQAPFASVTEHTTYRLDTVKRDQA